MSNKPDRHTGYRWQPTAEYMRDCRIENAVKELGWFAHDTLAGERKLAGLCIHACGKRADPGLVSCAPCRERLKHRQREALVRRRREQLAENELRAKHAKPREHTINGVTYVVVGP